MIAAPLIAGADLTTTVRRVAGPGHPNFRGASAAADGRDVPRLEKEPA